jgi:hypothetical protein
MRDPVPEERGYIVNALEIGFEGNTRVIRPHNEALWDQDPRVRTIAPSVPELMLSR